MDHQAVPAKHPPCSQLTKRGAPCPFEGDRLGPHGLPVCHIHDPAGKFRENVGLERERRAQRKRDRAELVECRTRAMTEARADDSPKTPLVGIDPNWHRDDGCPFEPGMFHGRS